MLSKVIGVVLIVVYSIAWFGIGLNEADFSDNLAKTTNCEQSLPRGETCMLIAVPKKESNDAS